MPTSKMSMQQLYMTLKNNFLQTIKDYSLSAEEIIIKSKSLTAKEAIGITKRKDFPIITGKEIMLQAEYMGATGQAFTDSPAVFSGTFDEILQLDIIHERHARGLFIASLNAVMRHLSLADKTVHCKNSNLETCAQKYVSYIKDTYSNPRIVLVGFQPALLENLAKEFNVRVLDLNPENIGTSKYNILIENGEDNYDEVVLEWAELILCTGSTISNGSLINYIDIGKEVIFFGTTISGAAEILGLKRLCFCST